jgi:hypothetical protein
MQSYKAPNNRRSHVRITTKLKIMKHKYTNQQIISGLLVMLSLASLTILMLQLSAPAHGPASVATLMKSGTTVPDMYALFSNGAFIHATFGPTYLAVCLGLIALLSLFTFRSSRRPDDYN